MRLNILLKVLDRKGDEVMGRIEEDRKNLDKKNIQPDECPAKEEDGNCLVPGVYSDSEPIGGS